MVLAALAVALLCAPSAALAATVPEVAQLTTDPAPDAKFGNVVATAGDLVVVGDVGDEKVRVYQRPAGGWPGVDDEPVATLFRPDLPAGSGFGESVDVSDDGSLIVVGAPWFDGPVKLDIGRVYAFKRPAGGWTGNPEPYTADPSSTPRNYFSDEPLTSFEIVYDRAMQGLQVLAAPDGSWLGYTSNRYWQPDGFQELYDAGGQAALISLFPLETTRPDSANRRLWVDGPLDAITSLAVDDDGTTIFAGQPWAWGGTGFIRAWNEPEAGWGSGAGGSWQAHEAEIAAPIVLGQSAYTGASLDASGDWLVAGAPRAKVGDASQAGKVFVWKKPAEGWHKLSPPPTGPEPWDGIMPVATLTASDPAAGARFGQGASILDDAIGVAAPRASVGANANQGKAYVFREPSSGWAGEIDDEVVQFAALGGAAEDELGSYGATSSTEAGHGVALTAGALVASAPIKGKPTYVFELKPQLSVATSGGGSGTVSGGAIDCPGTCESSEWLGDTVTLTATPAAGSVFTGWSGACDGNGPCEVTMDGSREVIANFAGLPPPVEVSLTVTIAGQGSVSGGGIDCPGTCEVSKTVGSTVTLTATPAQGWTFSGWEGAGCSGTGECAVALEDDENVSATFVQKPTDSDPQPPAGQPPAGGGAPQPPSPPAGPTTKPKKPLKCKKGFVKKKSKGKARCVKRKKKQKKRG